MDESTAHEAKTALPPAYAYSLTRRLLVAGGLVLICVPLGSVLWFLLTHPPAVTDLGPSLLVILFLLAPPIFLVLRFGHYFRRFQVEPRRLVITTFNRQWSIHWFDITRIVRKARVNTLGVRSYRVSVHVEPPDGQEDWLQLFDSALVQADQFYAQLVHHVPHVKPKEIEDRAWGAGL